MKFKMIENYDLYTYKEINLMPGVYFLTTANGNGKSTFLKNIAHNDNFVELRRGISGELKLEKEIDKDSVVFFRYNAEDDNNRSRARTNDLNLDTRSVIQAMMVDSEGQNRYRSFVDVVQDVGTAISLHKRKGNRVVILLDALDSGLDINYCRKLREFFGNTVAKDIEGMKVWVLIAANQFAFLKGQCCLDVNNGDILCFEEYDKYESYIEAKAKKESQRIKKKSSKGRSN